MHHEIRTRGVEYALTTEHPASEGGEPVLVLNGVVNFHPRDFNVCEIDAASDEAIAELRRLGFPVLDKRGR